MLHSTGPISSTNGAAPDLISGYIILSLLSVALRLLPFTSLFISFYMCPPTSLSICLFVCLSLSSCLSLSVCCLFLSLLVCLWLSVSVTICLYHYVCLCIFLSVCLSVCLCACRSLSFFILISPYSSWFIPIFSTHLRLSYSARQLIN